MLKKYLGLLIVHFYITVLPNASAENIEEGEYQKEQVVVIDVKKQLGPKISIIIDDIGYHYDNGIATIALQHNITYALIPFTPHVKTLAEFAKQQQKEVMLHAPMEALNDKLIEPGLSLSMDKAAIETSLTKMLEQVPSAQGVNNHGGSLFTQNEDHISWLLDIVNHRGLYFIDSRTTAASKAAKYAAIQNIPFGERDVFIDNIRSVEEINNQLNKVKHIATKQGYAIAIGHPYPETIAALKTTLPQFEQEGFRLVFASDIVR